MIHRHTATSYISWGHTQTSKHACKCISLTHITYTHMLTHTQTHAHAQNTSVYTHNTYTQTHMQTHSWTNTNTCARTQYTHAHIHRTHMHTHTIYIQVLHAWIIIEQYLSSLYLICNVEGWVALVHHWSSSATNETCIHFNSNASYCKVNRHHQVNLVTSVSVVHNGEDWVHFTKVAATEQVICSH